MIIVDLYIRVSTDDQNDGYSPAFQEDTLRRYCELKNYVINKVYHEDHSAKTFNRPRFNEMLINYRKQKGCVNMLLFTKWDRFSRSAAEAYGMITTLNKLGLQPVAIEQPIDMNIPENKIMLAIYLATPEVENHRRSINVTDGMYRALKEGRYMGKAPFGYINKKDIKRKWIEPDPATKDHVARIFEEVAAGKFSVLSLLKESRKKGYPFGKHSFWNMLRNPLYCGKIIVPPYKGEAGMAVNGQHEALISEDLFYQVQDVLNGRRKIQKAKKKEDERFPLRGFLQCHSDGRMLTASASTGRRKKKYEYYHCISACGTRFPTAVANAALVDELRKWKPHPAVLVLYRHILQDVVERQKKEQNKQLKKIQEEMYALIKRRQKALDLLLEDAMDPADYRTVKDTCDQEIARLEARIAEITSQVPVHLPENMDKAVQVLQQLDVLYEKSPVDVKREIIGSIFPEKLIFDGHTYRTARVNEAVQLIFNLGAAFSQKDTGHPEEISAMSREVIPITHFSNHFMYDLKRLVALFPRLNTA